MLLFSCVTSEDIIKVFDTASMKMIACIRNVCFDEEKIGFRSGTRFGGYTVVAGCYNNSISIIDNRCFKIIKTIMVGAYPVSVVSNNNYAYVACGDSDSIWGINKDLEIAFVNNTVAFPYGLSALDNELSICGIGDGKIHTYDADMKIRKRELLVDGYPFGLAYFDTNLVAVSNSDEGGIIYFRGRSIKAGERIGKMVTFDKKIYVCLDEVYIAVFNEQLEILNRIIVGEAISDFVVCEEGIFISELLGNYIKKFSQDGKELGRINAGFSNCSLILV